MEATFIDCMASDDQDVFVNYSHSMRDLAATFKLSKDQMNSTGGSMRFRRRKRESSSEDLVRNIFGVGNALPPMKNKHLTCRIIPTKIVGFSRVQ